VRTGNLVFLSGPHRAPGRQALGRPAGPDDLGTEEGKAAARAIAIDLLGTLQAAVGDLGKVKRIVKVMSLVNSAPTFTEQHLVTNGCSELLGQVFGPPAPTPAAPSAWRRSRWAPASRSS
jgi:enamine deaminase RidA (YjgF/YER057c/UK114 family)